MVRYFYAWTPLALVVGTFVLVTVPFLALIALLLVSLVALAALAWAIVATTRVLGRAIGRRWQGRSGASRRAAASPVYSAVRLTRPVPAHATLLLAGRVPNATGDMTVITASSRERATQ